MTELLAAIPQLFARQGYSAELLSLRGTELTNLVWCSTERQFLEAVKMVVDEAEKNNPAQPGE